MAYYTGAITSSTPAKTFADAMDPMFTGNGWAFVETWTSGNITANVYKNPSTNNSFGSDFYVATYRTSDASTALSFLLFEAWDAVNKKAIRYVPSATSVPDSTTYAVNDPTGLLLNGNVNKSAFVTLATSTFNYYVNVNADRIIAGTSPTSGLSVYVGLFDSLINGDPFPIGILTIPGNSAAGTGNGGVTREPFQTIANTYNFFASICQTNTNTFVNNFSCAFGILTAGQTPNANIYTGSLPMWKIYFSSCRSLSTTGEGARGVLKDVYGAFATGSAGDTITYVSGSTTYTLVRFHGQAFASNASLFIPVV